MGLPSNSIPSRTKEHSLPQNIAVPVMRLNTTAYEALEKQLGLPIPTTTTTDIQAGYLLGVQHVLVLLRKGYVVS